MSVLPQITQFAAEEATGIGVLGIDPIAILLQAGTFLILFFVIKKFALQQIVDSLEERRKKIEQSLFEAEELQSQNNAAQGKVEKLLKAARADSEAIIAKAHEEAGSMMKTSEDATTKKAEKMVMDAEARIQSDIIKAKKELRSEMLMLVAQATETVIGEKLDVKKDAVLLEKALAGDK